MHPTKWNSWPALMFCHRGAILSVSERKDSLTKARDKVKWIPAVEEADISKAQLLAGNMFWNLTL
jgi:hypothetical protein